MMFSREWRLLVHRKGWGPVLILAILVITFGVLLDQMLRQNLRMRNDLESKQKAVDNARAKKELLGNVEQTRDGVRSALAAVSSRLVPGTDGPADSGEKLASQLKAWYANIGVKDSAVVNATTRDESGLGYLRATLVAPMRIEQLNSVLQTKGSAPLALRMIDATIEANDLTTPSGLRTTITWEALRGPAAAIPPVLDKKTPSKSPATNRTEATVRTVERSNRRLDNSVETEEKRK